MKTVWLIKKQYDRAGKFIDYLKIPVTSVHEDRDIANWNEIFRNKMVFSNNSLLCMSYPQYNLLDQFFNLKISQELCWSGRYTQQTNRTDLDLRLITYNSVEVLPIAHECYMCAEQFEIRGSFITLCEKHYNENLDEAIRRFRNE